MSDQSLLHADSIGLDNSLSRKIVSGEWQHTVMAGGSFTRTRLLRYSDTSNSNVIGVTWPPVASDFNITVL